MRRRRQGKGPLAHSFRDSRPRQRRPIMLRVAPILVALLGVTSLFAAAARAEDSADGAAFVVVPELQAGFHFLYEQKFPEARQTFLGWEKQHPDDPFGHVAVAASYLFEELYRQGVLTSDFFLNDKRFLRGIDGKPDAGRMRSEEHTSELQSRLHLVCRLLLEKKNKHPTRTRTE